MFTDRKKRKKKRKRRSGEGLLLPGRENENRGKENSPDERDESHYCTDGDTLLLDYLCRKNKLIF